MASTFVCSCNDVISNVGVLAAAGLVAATSSPWPDILIGLAMAAAVLQPAVRLLDRVLQLRLAANLMRLS